jgi:hypothetical protein
MIAGLLDLATIKRPLLHGLERPMSKSGSREGYLMKKLLLGLATLPFIAGVAMAGQPALLSDGQMDKVTAGFQGTVTIAIPADALADIKADSVADISIGGEIVSFPAYPTSIPPTTVTVTGSVTVGFE